MSAVRVSDATLAYRRLFRSPRVAVSGLSLQVRRGEIVGLLGPNRAGKTTLVRALVGLLRPMRGTLEVNGHDPVHHRRRVVATTGVLLDSSHVVPPRWTGLEALMFAGTLHGFTQSEARRRALAWLERFALSGAEGELVNRYSRGMRQRLNLAMTFMHDPALVILDEPTLGLDADSSNTLRQVLLQVRRAGRSVLLTSHEMSLVEAVADSVVVLYQGQAIASGPAAEVALALGATRRVRVSVDSPPQCLAAWGELEIQGNTIHAPLDPAYLSRLFDWLARQEARIVNVSADSGLEAAVARLGGKGS